MLPSPRWPKGNGRRARDQRRHRLARPREELRHGGDRHGDVVLDRAALLLLHLGQRMADAPEGVGLLERARPARRPRRCPRPTPSPKIASTVGSASASRAGRRDLHQHVPVVPAGDRVARPRHVAEHHVDADPRDQLEGGEAGRGLRPGDVEKRERRLRVLRAPTKATLFPRGFGNSRSTAAVMMPSVPSAPMNRSRRS